MEWRPLEELNRAVLFERCHIIRDLFEIRVNTMRIFRVREFQENGRIKAEALGEISSVFYQKKCREDNVSEGQCDRTWDWGFVKEILIWKKDGIVSKGLERVQNVTRIRKENWGLCRERGKGRTPGWEKYDKRSE